MEGENQDITDPEQIGKRIGELLAKQWNSGEPMDPDAVPSGETSGEVFRELSDPQQLKAHLEDYKRSGEDFHNAYDELLTRISERRASRFAWRYYAAAACILIGFGFWGYSHYGSRVVVAPVVAHDVAPGGYHALLTLSNGQAIVLDSTHAGTTLATQGGTVVRRDASGSLAYTPSSTPITEVLYNTLSTRRGDTYKVLLPDGSAVWLNSSSSLRYPTSFTGASREVTLTGEGYFEIAPSPGHPFIVHTSKESVTVLGTRFNIMAYEDEPAVATSLLSGSVKVSSSASSLVLHPGEQVRLTSLFEVVPSADMEAAVAWKNAVFDFNNEPLPVILRSLSRWYDVDVRYEGPDFPSGILFSAYISRDLPVSKVLHLLSETKEVTFDIEGKTIIVKR